MALQTSGAISLNEIHIEAGGTTGTTATINDADIRALIGKASGVAMSFSEWYGASAAYYREEMVPDYWTISSPYNTTQNSGYWELGGQGTFDTLGGTSAPSTSFSSTVGGVTGTHYISRLQTQIAASGAPTVLIFTIYNITNTAYSTTGTTTPTNLQAYTGSDYSTGNILNQTLSSGSKSAGALTIAGTSRQTMTFTWSGAVAMGTVFGTNSGYQNGNGTKYIQIV